MPVTRRPPPTPAAGVVFPSQPGTYALLLVLDEEMDLRVGALGSIRLPSAHYVYTGSAFGPGGLAARISRHLRGGRPHWHIDILRAASGITAVCFTASDERLECRWAQALASSTGARIPAPGFGASDCGSGCRSHLIAFPRGISPARVRAMLTSASPAGSSIRTAAIPSGMQVPKSG
jgi:Uri superfamily endonuclease